MPKPEKSLANESFIDTMILGGGHSLMLSSIPKNLDPQKVVEEFKEFSKLNETAASFGLFTSPNYNTYYPDTTEDDIKPNDEDFIEPTYRMLSACIVAKKYNPTDFSKPGVLKASMHLLLGQSVYPDHNSDVGNAIGSVKNVMWQDSFKQGGVIVPAGINGLLKIDGKSNPRIARGILMDPPSIHSNSVTVQFEWEPSHTFEEPYEFYRKMGTYDDKGVMIRRVVTKIISYAETSLVSHGADPFAQKIKDNGQLNSIAYAKAQYYGDTTMSNSEKNHLVDTEINKMVYFGDYKNLDSLEDGNISTMINSEGHKTSVINNNQEESSNKENNNQKPTNIMTEEELQLFLSSLFGNNSLSLSEGETISKDLVLTKIQELREENNQLKTEKTGLTAKAALADKHLGEVRNEAISNYSKLVGTNGDENILSLLSADSTNLETLQSLSKTYQQQLDDKFPMSCSACGSKDVSRASSLKEVEDKGNTPGKVPSIAETVDALANQSLKNK